MTTTSAREFDPKLYTGGIFHITTRAIAPLQPRWDYNHMMRGMITDARIVLDKDGSRSIRISFASCQKESVVNGKIVWVDAHDRGFEHFLFDAVPDVRPDGTVFMNINRSHGTGPMRAHIAIALFPPDPPK